MEKEFRFSTDITDTKNKKLIKEILKDEKYTLLTQFIVEKSFNYKEPQRKGTPKGDPIGFSKKKYFVSLIMLTNHKQKDIAKMAQVSFGLLRKWRTEKQFKEMILNHCADFIPVFVGYIYRRIGTEHISQERLKKKTLQKLSKTNLLHYRSQVQRKFDTGYDKLSDLNRYSVVLTEFLFGFLSEYIEKDLPNIADSNLQFIFTNEVLSIVSLIKHYQGVPKSDEVKKKSEEMETKINNRHIDAIIEIILKPKINSNDKKDIIIGLKYMNLLNTFKS